MATKIKLSFISFFLTVLSVVRCQQSQSQRPFTCPNNGLPFDYQSCDPEKRSECPAGFTCRPSNNTMTNQAVNLCCESGSMTISDWLASKQLVPQVLPQAPSSTIEKLQLAPISSNLKFPSIHIGDEVVVLSFPNYLTGVIQSVTTTQLINPGYIHVVTVVDAGYKPFALMVNYNIAVTQPSQFFNVTSSLQFIAYLDNTTMVSRSSSYRSQYVVLVYYTQSTIQFDGTTPKDMLLGSSCNDAKCLFSNSPFSARLFQPTAGTLFYLTTAQTVFSTDDTIVKSGNSISGSYNFLSIMLWAVMYLLF